MEGHGERENSPSKHAKPFPLSASYTKSAGRLSSTNRLQGPLLYQWNTITNPSKLQSLFYSCLCHLSKVFGITGKEGAQNRQFSIAIHHLLILKGRVRVKDSRHHSLLCLLGARDPDWQVEVLRHALHMCTE